ncbi:MAG: hypothetical protein WD669_07640 [Pirellulales bacterium]
MIRPVCETAYWKAAAVRCVRLFAASATAAAVFASWPGTGSAQPSITKEILIGDAVADIGPKYSDVDEAIKRFNNRDPLSARALLEEARRKAPTLPPSDLTLAKMYFLSGNAQAGRAQLEKTVTENAGDPEAYLILADQDLSQGGTVEAEALYDKALLLTEKFNDNPKRKRNFGIKARWGRALISEQRKNWTAMGRDLQDLLKIDENHAAARYRMGRALCMLNKFPEGKAAFEAAKKEDKKLPGAWLAVATMYDLLGRTDDAKKAFGEALKEDQADLGTMVQHAQFLIKIGSLDEATTRLALASRAHPESLDVFILSGAAAFMNGKLKEAEEFFITANGKSPANIVVINQLALLLIESAKEDDRSRAMAFALMNAKVNNNSADAQITLSWVNYKLGRPAEASAALRQGLQLGTLSPDSSYLVAAMLASQNQPEQLDAAKRLLSEALAATNTGIFVRKKEAQDLLKKLSGGAGVSTAGEK